MGETKTQFRRSLRARLVSPESPADATYTADAVVIINEDGKIADVGPYTGQTVDEDLTPGVLTPGFVDGHVHYPQCRVIGQAAGPLLEWLDRVVFPEEARFSDGAYAGTVAAEFCDQLVSAGTTLSLVYGSPHISATTSLLEEARDRGLHMITGPVLMDQGAPEENLVPLGAALEGLQGLVEAWHGADEGRLRLAVIPRFALSCTRPLLQAAGDLSRQHGLIVSTHLSETPAECEAVRTLFSAPDYLSVYEEAGLVHERTVMAHCLHLSEGEWRRMEAAGATVAHCPDSNAFLGSGGLDTPRVLGGACPVVMGSDVAAGRSFRIQAALAHAYDNGLAKGVRLGLERLLWMGTRGGALALNSPSTGAIAPGLDADLVLHEVPEAAQGVDQVLGHLLFNRDTQGALKTWSRGRLVWDRAATGVAKDD